jgi:hypothetical protein
MNTMTPLMSGQEPKLFEPDALAPEQFYATLRRSNFTDPERRLMAAILEDAVSCLSKDLYRSPRGHRKQFAEAHSWINSDGTEDWIFSFTNVCETLGFNPSYLRQGLNRWSAFSRTGASPKLRLKKYRSGSRRRKLRFRSTA